MGYIRSPDKSGSLISVAHRGAGFALDVRQAFASRTSPIFGKYGSTHWTFDLHTQSDNMKAFIVVLLASVSLTCSKRTEAPKPVDEKHYFPMALGNKWEYIQDFSAIEGFLSKLIGSSKITESVQVTDGSDNEFLFEEASYIGNLPAIKTKHIYEFRNDMLMLVASGGGVQNTQMKQLIPKPILLKFPLQPNSSWEYKDDKQQIHHLRVERRHDTLSVLGKTYQNVIEVSDSIEHVEIEYKYYAYGVGLIKVESLSIDPQTISRWRSLQEKNPEYKHARLTSFQLKSYNVKSPPSQSEM